MGMCKKCYKRGNCIERDKHGRCSEYRDIEEIKKEIEDIMQSFKVAETESTACEVAGRENDEL